MPVERIRQIIAATRFQAATEEIGLKVVGGVVCGTADDKADCLINRLNTAWQYAVEKDEFSSCLDDGSGPQGIKPYRIEVEESECQLVTS
jgi:hypothetical protein